MFLELEHYAGNGVVKSAVAQSLSPVPYTPLLPIRF